MSQTVLANALFERGDAFVQLSLRAEGTELTVEAVEGGVEAGARHGRLLVCWSGADRTEAEMAFTGRQADLEKLGYVRH